MSPHRAARRLYRAAAVQPFEVFIGFLCVLAGLPLLLQGPGPGSLEEALPRFLVILWGVELVAGGILTLAGLTFSSRRSEVLGLSLLSAASAVYGIVLLTVVWPDGIVAAAIVGGFSIACFARIRAMRYQDPRP